MDYLVEINEDEVLNVSGGGIASAVAGGLAGGMIGAYAGLIPAVVTGDASYVTKAAVTGATVGMWAGLGFPTP